MNPLSWLLYLADISETINHCFSFLLMLITVVTAICLIFGFINLDMAWDDEDRDKAKRVMNLPLKFILPASIMIFIMIVVPSKQTIYLIAASEMGEEAIKSDLGKKVLTYLEQELDKVEN